MQVPRRRLIRFPVICAKSAFVPPDIARLAVKITAFFAVRTSTAHVAEYVIASAALLGFSFIAVIAQCGVTSCTIGYFGSGATAIAPVALAGIAENKIPLTLVAGLTNRVQASLASFTSGANKAARSPRARFTTLEVTDAARDVGLCPRAPFPVCAHDLLVAVITEVHQNNFIIFHTERAVRVFATLALTAFIYDTITSSALAQVEGSLQ